MAHIRTKLVEDDLNRFSFVESVSISEETETDSMLLQHDTNLGESHNYIEDDILQIVEVSLLECDSVDPDTVKSILLSVLPNYCPEFGKYTNPSVVTKYFPEDHSIKSYIVSLVSK